MNCAIWESVPVRYLSGVFIGTHPLKFLSGTPRQFIPVSSSRRGQPVMRWLGQPAIPGGTVAPRKRGGERQVGAQALQSRPSGTARPSPAGPLPPRGMERGCFSTPAPGLCQPAPETAADLFGSLLGLSVPQSAPVRLPPLFSHESNQRNSLRGREGRASQPHQKPSFFLPPPQPGQVPPEADAGGPPCVPPRLPKGNLAGLPRGAWRRERKAALYFGEALSPAPTPCWLGIMEAEVQPF